MTNAPKDKNILIRAAFEEDVEAISALAGQLGYKSEAEEIRRRLDTIKGQDEHQVFVAEAADEGVVGWVHVMRVHRLVTETSAELGGLIVKDGWRGQGVGRLLLERAEGWARAHNLMHMRINSNVSRLGTPKFYESMGFVLIKTQNVFHISLEQ